MPVALQDERHDLGVVAFDGRLHGDELVREPRPVDDVDRRAFARDSPTPIGEIGKLASMDR